MLSRKLFLFAHKIALFAIVFASLAPSISHALASQQETSNFLQEICTAVGETITIKIEASNNQLFGAESKNKKDKPSTSQILRHLNHCPFCSNPQVDQAIATHHKTNVVRLECRTQQELVSSQVVLSRFSILPPPAQAPPIFS